MSKTVGDLVKYFKLDYVSTNLSQAITDISTNSNSVESGHIFIALPGEKFDGYNFIPAALSLGASICFSQQEYDDPRVIHVNDTKIFLQELLSWFYDQPDKDIKLIGITGTNGKTTINWIINSIINKLGFKCLRVGTLGIVGLGLNEESLTTPDILKVYNCLAAARDNGCSHCVIETSSHGLLQGRVAGLKFDIGIFTNLTQDHLDYHGTLDKYFEAKKILFQNIKPDGIGIINKSIWGDKIKGLCKTISYGNKEADCKIANFSQSYDGSSFEIIYNSQNYFVQSKLTGFHNAENLTAVFLSLISLGIDIKTIIQELSIVSAPPGRFESVNNYPKVIVDYAHTPDALENVLNSGRALCKGKLWVVFGCGGDRDRGKRSQMGSIAENMADCVVVTSDNPRTEDPNQIISDILEDGVKPLMVEVDRKLAIHKCLEKAENDDLVLICGKGHEDYQIIGTTKTYFSDQQVVKDFYGNTQ